MLLSNQVTNMIAFFHTNAIFQLKFLKITLVLWNFYLSIPFVPLKFAFITKYQNAKGIEEG